MKQYKFNFDKFSLIHMLMLSHSDISCRMWAVDELTEGDITRLPLPELENLLKQFAVALNEYSDNMKAENEARITGDSGIDDEVVSDMLDGIEGL